MTLGFEENHHALDVQSAMGFSNPCILNLKVCACVRVCVRVCVSDLLLPVLILFLDDRGNNIQRQNIIQPRDGTYDILLLVFDGVSLHLFQC